MKKNEAKTTIPEILNLRRYNPNYIPPQEKAILTINQKICGTAENYCVISGLPKSCKSTFLSAFTASALMLDDVWNIKISLQPGKEKIAYFDTESSAYDMYRQMQRIQKFTKRDYLPWEHLDAFNVREDEPQRIIEYINCYLQNNVCSVIIVDGLLDLCNDFNDTLEAKRITSWLKRITKLYNILIICVVHLGKKDGNTLGHLGSFADRYAQTVLEVVKDKEQQTFTLQSKFMRSDADFEPISIKNFLGNWELVHYEPTPQQNFKQPKK
jgi:hypothetical protein